MKHIAAILLLSSALSTAALAGGPGPDEEPFFWSGGDAQTNVTTNIPTPAAPAPVVEPATPVRNDTKEQANPIHVGYPSRDAPVLSSRNRFENDCNTGGFYHSGGGMPAQDVYSRPGSASLPIGVRRGEMTGDDGVVEMIQDSPCALVYRRGGENFPSLRRYTHPEDIRRVNVMEDRIPPHHSVGRMASYGQSGNWAVDPGNPYVDARRNWIARKGMMLSELLVLWGEQSGYEVVWKSPHDYVIRADLVITGTFPEVSGQVIASFEDANPPISGEYYLKNRVLVVDSSSNFDAR